MAVGGALLQDAQRGDGGRPRRAGTRQRRARKPSKVVGAGDAVEVTIGTARQTVAGPLSPSAGPASAAVTMYAETPESRAAREQHGLERRLARPLGADLGAPNQAGAASARRPPPRTAARALSSAGDRVLPAASRRRNRAAARLSEDTARQGGFHGLRGTEGAEGGYVDLGIALALRWRRSGSLAR